MKKGKVARLTGFVGALGVSTVLVTMAVQGTGAYFTDEAGGNLYASSGSLAITAGGTNINFSGLNPGQDKSQTLTYSVNASSTTSADIWLVFDPNSAAYGAFTGANGGSVNATTYNNYVDGGMGQFGHFKVHGNAGSFESYNLKLEDPADAMRAYTTHGTYTDTSTTNTCNVNADGHGGSTAQHHSANASPGTKNDIADCGVPAAILLTKNLAPGHGSSATVTFGLTGKQTQQNQPNDPNVSFKIVATQPGQYPLTSTGDVGSNF